MPLRSTHCFPLPLLVLAALATPLAAAPPEIHQRLVRLDRELQGSFAALSLGGPAPSQEDRRRLTSTLLALDGEIARTTDLVDREALAEKCGRLRRLAADLDAAARATTPAGPASRPRPTPLVARDGATGLALAPPGNDACGDAAILTVEAAATGTLAEATHDGQASCGSSLFAQDVWYRFDPPTSAYYSLDSLGSNFDTVVSVHDGCPGTLENEDVCNDDGLGLASSLEFYGYPGGTRWIRVAGYGGDTGLYQLQVGTGATLTGTVSTADTLTPRAGVQVQIYRDGSTYADSSAMTGADGRFTVADVSAGLYRVWARSLGDYLDTPHGGCPGGADACAISAAPTVTVGSNGTVSGIDVAQRRGAALLGRVTHANGTAFPAVTLVAWDPVTDDALVTADSDASGNYRLAPLPAGSWTVYTSEDGVMNEAWPDLSCESDYYCGDRGMPIPVATAGTVTGIDFTLDQLGSLAGRVTDALTGAPVASAEVRFYTAGGSWLGYDYTDATGSYSFSGLATGSYRAIAAGPYGGPYGNELYRELACGEDCQVTAGTAIPVSVNATTPNVDFTLAHLGSPSGQVTSTGGTGLNGIWLRLFDSSGWLVSSVLSDATGNYSFPSLEAGSYFLRTESSSGWLDEVFDDRPCGPQCDVTTGTSILVRDGLPSLASFTLGPGAVISGTITEAGTGAGLGSGAVQLWSAEGGLVREIRQPTTGSFSLVGLAAGTYYLTTDDNPSHRDELYDDLPCEGSCIVTAGTPIVLAEAGSLNRSFVLDRQATIEGFVVPEAGGAPLASWGVVLYTNTGQYLRQTYTISNGFYRFEGLTPGSYRLRTDGYGDYVDELHPNLPCEPSCSIDAGQLVTVGAGSSVAVSFGLTAFGHLRGTVRNQATGTPLSSAYVQATQPSGSASDSSYSLADGTFDLAVPPGTYGVHAGRSGFVTEMWQELPCGVDPFGDPYCDPALGTPVVVTAGGSTGGVDFTLVATGALSGSVTDALTGNPIDAQVRIWTASGIEVAYAYTNSSGIFTVSGLAPGTYHLTTDNFEGFIDELWSDLPCLNGPPYGCKVRRGTPVAVASGTTSRNLHLRLERFAGQTNTGFAGQVIDGATAAPLVGVTIDVWDGFGQHRGSAVTGPNGTYRLALSSGDYFVSTDNALGFTNQVWPSLPCPGGSAYSGACNPTTGTIVTVPATGGVDFELLPPVAIFADGFESGNASAWSVVVP